MDLDFGQDFEELSQRLRAEQYQDDLDRLTQEYEDTLTKLIEVRGKISAQKSAILFQAKEGITVVVEGKEKRFKASNEEDRDAVLDYFLGEDYRLEKNLLDRIKFYDLACKNKRQCLSAEQSKMSVDKVVAQALGAGQL